MRMLWMWLVVVAVSAVGCGKAHEPQRAQDFTAQDRAAAEASVRQFMSSVEQDVTRNGPEAWTHSFSSDPSFFMVSDGVEVFPSGAAAAEAIPSLKQMIHKIELHWGEDLRVDSLSPEFAVVGASWRETREMQGHEVKEQGFFTGVVEQRDGRWQFRNVHWSTKKAEETGGKGN